jgi:hypothetical protein
MGEHPAEAAPVRTQAEPVHADEPIVVSAAAAPTVDVVSPPSERAPAPRFDPHPALEPAPAHEAVSPRDAPELPRISLDLPPDSGLVLVETSHARVPPVQVQEEPDAARPRRVRPPRTDTQEEPLQLVETAHKDSTPPAE